MKENLNKKFNVKKIMGIYNEILNEANTIRPYVVIAHPRRDQTETPVQKLDGYNGLHIDLLGYSHGYCSTNNLPVDVARNYLIDQVIDSGAKYLLFCGEDTALPYDGFLKLHEVAEQNPDAMVVGVYYIKFSSPMIHINVDNHIIPANVDPGRIFEAWQTGLDAALIPVSILKTMREEDPELPYCCIINMENSPHIGEDNFFVYRLRKLGFRLLVNTDVQALHCDLSLHKYTAHPMITPEIIKNKYYTNFPLVGPLTMEDKQIVDQRWIDRLPKIESIKNT